MTDTQTALHIDTPLGAGTVRRLETSPRPSGRLTNETWSYATSIQPDAIEAGNPDGSLKLVYKLFFPAQLNDNKTMLTKPKSWDFPRDLSKLQEMVAAEFPNGFGNKYRAAINWYVRWCMSGTQLIVREILKVEGPMPAPTELDEHLNANVDQKPIHWIDNDKARSSFWATVTPWIKWAGYDGKPDTFVHETIGKLHDYTDGYWGAVDDVCKAAMRSVTRTKIQRGMSKQDFIDAIGYDTFDAIRGKGTLSDKDIMQAYDDYLASDKHIGNAPKTDKHLPAEPPAPAAAETGAQAPTTGATPVPAMVTPVATTNATNRPVEAKNGQSSTPATVKRPVLKLVDQVASIRTMAGIPIADIHKELDREHPRNAYKGIKLAGGKPGTDIGSDFVRNRFEEVFGGHGIGWKFEALTGLGDVRWEQLDVDGGLKYQVTIIMHVFKYRVVMPDGSLEWVELSPMSDVGTNVKASYAHRSAFTALLKQVLRSLGGMDHLKGRAA